jgi:hypothetical protein
LTAQITSDAELSKFWKVAAHGANTLSTFHPVKVFFKALAMLLLLSHAVAAGDIAWPRLDAGDPGNGVCGEALALARSSYQSDNFYLYALPDLRSAATVTSTFALRQGEQDLSGGDGLVEDRSVFQKIPKPTGDQPSPRSVYWQIKPDRGLRYVMSEEAFGWRGDQYTLFAINENMTPSQFFEAYGSDTSKSALLPVIDETWRPPLMMREIGNGEVWAIDVGPPYVAFTDWRVYSIAADGAKKRCTLRFHGRNDLGPALLPKPVQRLAALLDRSLDDKDDQGTMHFVTGLRQYIRYLWTNIALRPQAFVKQEPTVSRAEADTEVGKWAGRTSRFRKLGMEIFSQFPRAQKSLADYYKDRFKKPDEQADAMAQQALDIVFRSYFNRPSG